MLADLPKQLNVMVIRREIYEGFIAEFGEEDTQELREEVNLFDTTTRTKKVRTMMTRARKQAEYESMGK